MNSSSVRLFVCSGLFGLCSVSVLWHADSIAVEVNRDHGLRSEKDRACGAEALRGCVLELEVGGEEGEQPAPAEERAAGNPARVGRGSQR